MHFISAGDIINNNYTFYNCTEQQVTNHFPYVGKGNSPCRISEGGIEDRVGSSDVRDGGGDAVPNGHHGCRWQQRVLSTLLAEWGILNHTHVLMNYVETNSSAF